MQLSAYNYDMYAIDGNYMLVNASFGTSTLTLNYYSNNLAKTSAGSWIANLSASTDEPLMDIKYQYGLVDYADALCQRKEGNLDDYQLAMASFNLILKDIKANSPSRKQTASKQMKNTRKLQDSGYADKSDPLNQIS
jgi:uncharacterized protein YfdQ (DUF2303 family)